ncbi:uncharacterized protein EAE97_010391 [Botrytis byssoidea]|uniref:Uncharacterized protein n=1 Tax=Botrytis byssoidea TaxID=139641 RepID=A0A9P5I7Z7_9HELO|nr:uncharacterized protein EAE97_010391 [Botrytis byssoidea]KAF7926091.1 hypothetical protein EAE97_010391 [Botrytis byssoidea]
MDSPFSDRWFEDACRREELLMLHQLRKQNSAVDDTFFPYGLIFAGLPPWEVHPIVYKQYSVGSDVERTVTYVSAALDYINRKTQRLQTDAWLFHVDRNSKRVSWSHNTFAPYQYDQQVAEQRIGKILMTAKVEESKIDADSVPWKYTCPDGTQLSGQLRCFPRGYEQHVDLLLKYNFLIVQNYADGSHSCISEPGIKDFIYAVANESFDSPIAEVANPPQLFHSLPETEYESLCKKRAVTRAPKKVLRGNFPAQRNNKRLCFTHPPDIMHEYQPHDFIQVTFPQDSEGCAKITEKLIPDYAVPSSLPGVSIGDPNILKTEFPLHSVQMTTPHHPGDCTEITKEEFQHCAIPSASSRRNDVGPKIWGKDDPPHFAIQVSASGGFGRDLDFMRN